MPEDIYWQKYAARFKSFPAVLAPDVSTAEIAVCIPVFAEPDLLLTLASLQNCTLPECIVDVLLCFNKNEEMSMEEHAIHNQSWKDCQHWIENNQSERLRFRPICYEVLPDPQGGVGWARKMVMDEAARRLEQCGVILCLDSDCTVSKNYLEEVYSYFLAHPDCQAASIYYQHQYEDLEVVTRKAIVDYELHLRYLVHALRWTEHPFAFQTVGSSMAVRRRGYLAHGGMNTRKAGEDFYFLQKFIEVDTLHEIKTTTVFPSSRISFRVPFGTGRAMHQLLSGHEEWLTTSFASYAELKLLLSKINLLRQVCIESPPEQTEQLLRLEFDAHPALLSYLDELDFYSECIQIVHQTASVTSFRKRLFRFLNAFRVMRYSHYMRDHYYPDTPVLEAVKSLAVELKWNQKNLNSAEDYLKLFRAIDKGL